MLVHNADITGSLTINGTRFNTGSFSGSFTGAVAGTTATASYVEYNNVANKPALVSGSSQITYSGLTGIPSGIVSSSAQITGYNIFATTGSNRFNGNQIITGSLTVSGSTTTLAGNTVITGSFTVTTGSNVELQVTNLGVNIGNITTDNHNITGSLLVSGSTRLNGNTVITGSFTVTTGSVVELQVTNLGVNIGNITTDNHNVTGSLRVSGSLTVTTTGTELQVTNTGVNLGNISTDVHNVTGSLLVSGSTRLNGNTVVTGSLTVTGQVVAQTLNVQQVTSSIVYSSGSNIFGNSLANTQQFTGSLQVSGSSHSILGNVGVGIAIPTNPLHIQSNTLSQLNVTALSGNTNAQINLEPTGTGIALIGPANNVDLAFRTNATTRMLISGSGDVGIGRTPSSGFKLDIQGNGGLRILDNDVLRSIIITPPNSGATGIISTASGQGLSFQATNVAGNLTFETAGVERMRITSSGSVGIGTDSPAGILTAAQSNANSITTVTVDNIASFPASAGTQGTILRFRSRIDDTAIRTTGAIASYAMKSTGAGANNNGDLRFYTGQEGDTNERMRITSGGNVVIGNTVASNVGLTIFGSNAATIYQTSNTGTGAGNGFYVGHTGDISYIWNYNNFPTVFATNNTERMRIRSTGQIGLGTTSPERQFVISNAGAEGIEFTSVGSQTYEIITYNRSTSAYTPLQFESSAYTFKRGAATFNSSVTATSFGGAFSITMQGAGNNGISDGPFYRFINTTNSYQLLKQLNASTGEDVWYYNGSAWSKVGNLNAVSGVYTALSDVNKKKDFEDSTIGLNAILGLKPTLYRMEDEDESVEKQLGFIAQEVKEYIPQACVEQENFVGLQDRPIIAALVKAIQELKAENDTLKSRIDTLEQA